MAHIIWDVDSYVFLKVEYEPYIADADSVFIFGAGSVE